jgi:hypothetical protein
MKSWANWKTTVAGLLSAFVGMVGPLTAYLATTTNPKAAEICGALTCAGAIARIWVGLIQSDAKPSVTSSVTIEAVTPEPQNPTQPNPK